MENFTTLLKSAKIFRTGFADQFSVRFAKFKFVVRAQFDRAKPDQGWGRPRADGRYSAAKSTFFKRTDFYYRVKVAR